MHRFPKSCLRKYRQGILRSSFFIIFPNRQDKITVILLGAMIYDRELLIMFQIDAGFSRRKYHVADFYVNISKKSNEFGERSTWLRSRGRRRDLLLLLNNFRASPQALYDVC
jgi:hypothetical protein